MSAEDDSCGSGGCGCASDQPVTTPGEAESNLLDRLDNESGFHPMGDDWEEQMRAQLEETDYDVELGMEMARDAMRLTSGEISEEEFYEQYNEAVVEEFGEDDRPMAEKFDFDDPDDGSIVDSLRDLADTDVSRRDTMKKGAFAAGALGLGGMLPRNEDDTADSGPVGTVSADSHDPGTEHRYGMVIDLDRCDGCLQCVVGCMNENRTSQGANWMYVMTWEDQTDGVGQQNFMVRPCQHCSNAPCAKVCPVQARHIRDRDGLVLTNYETCIGCRYCQVACPYGVNYFEWGHPEVPDDEISQVDYDASELRAMSPEEREDVLFESGDHKHDYRGFEVDSRGRKGTMGKCTFCPSRQDGNMGEDMVGTVACMEYCDEAGMSAIHFGDLDDPDSRPNRYLERAQEMSVPPDEKQERIEDPEEDWETPTSPHNTSQLSAFKLMEEMGTQPNIIYLGNEPGPNAEQVDDPPVEYHRLTADDGRSVVDTRKDVTDESTDWRAGS